MKKLTSVLLLMTMFLSFVPAMAAEEEAGKTRYTVLVLDNSGSSEFINTKTNETIYIADSALSYVKEAAKEFVEDVLLASGEGYGAESNQIAIVTYRSTATTQIGFTDDKEKLMKSISKLSASGTTRSITAGLERAEKLLDAIEDSNAIKNVVLIGTGYSNHGDYSYEGRYNKETVASNWHRIDTEIHFYAYANSTHVVADRLKEKANLYSLGIFQTMKEVPKEGEKAAEFFRLFAKDLASNSQCFIAVENPEEMEFAFDSLAVAMEDFDGDGLPNKWETDGVDIDGDGVVDLPLHEWGADPEVPDVFVEVDWMVRPETTGFLGFNKQEEKSFAPNSEALNMVCQVFKDHGINLHIDAGSNSIDFVTGKKWGIYAGGGTIVDYEKKFEGGKIVKDKDDSFPYWTWIVVPKIFDQKERGGVFRHVLYVDQYIGHDGVEAGGQTDGICGQYMVIANHQKDMMPELAQASVFMHELGHSLGLTHGGKHYRDDGNKTSDHTNNKPNYLSIMNYLFQTSGLCGVEGIARLNYSEYNLPALDERALTEQMGVDPEGLTAGTGLKTKISSNVFDGFEETDPIAWTAIDFNKNGKIDDGAVKVNINQDWEKNLLYDSLNDWENLNFRSHYIGEINDQKPTMDPEKWFHMAGALYEPTVEEHIKQGTFANSGAGSAQGVGPHTLFPDTLNQNIYIRVNNLAPSDGTYILIVDASDVNDRMEIVVDLPASIGKISYKDIPVPIKSGIKAGDYRIIATLQSKGHDDIKIEIPLNIEAPTEEQLMALKSGLSDETIELSDAARNEYKSILNTYTLSVESTSGGTVSNEGKTSVETGGTVEIEAQSKNGYRFIGWKSSNGGTFADENSLKTTFTMPKGDTVLTACFTENVTGTSSGSNHCVIRFESNGGSKVNAKTVARNGSISEPVAPEKEEYKFMGWYTDQNFTTLYDFSSGITKDMTLYAMWEDIENFQIKLWIGSKYAKVFGTMVENDVAPQVVKDRTMLPIRFVAETLGAIVNWNEAEPDKVQILRDGKQIDIYIGSAEAYVNGEKTLLDSPAFIESDRTFLPVRFVSENLGAKVDWDGTLEKVTITK